MHIYIIANTQKKNEQPIVSEIVSVLEEKGVRYTIQTEEFLPPEKLDGRGEDRVPADVDMCLVLGGDGTLLRAANQVMDREIPLMGVNLGSVGYMAEVEPKDIRPAIEQYLKGDYILENRMLLYGKVVRNGIALTDNRALNDIVVARSSSLQIFHYRVYVNGKLLKVFHADGMIVATPTGSTGYNMSAGGPLIEPTARVLLLTPICPHTLTTRSVVLSPENRISITVDEHDKAVKIGENTGVEISFDGYSRFPLAFGDTLEIRASGKVAKIVHLKEQNFLEVLHRKMSEV